MENKKLTKREKDVLVLIGQGMTTKEISINLGIADSTIETHRRNLIAKTGAKGTKGLVKYANYNQQNKKIEEVVAWAKLEVEQCSELLLNPDIDINEAIKLMSRRNTLNQVVNRLQYDL